MTEFPNIPIGPPISKEDFLKLCKWFEDNAEENHKEYMERYERNTGAIINRILADSKQGLGSSVG